MVAEYFSRTSLYVNNESSGIKAERSVQSKYGDEAIGKVQIKKSETACTVSADVTPEHKIKSQPYKVLVDVDLRHSKIKSAVCKGCVAALGGCKHAVALIGWLHRRSEEPSPTDELCYWKKSLLATVDTSKPYLSDGSESSEYSDSEKEDDDGFVATFARECKKQKIKNCHFLLHYDFETFSVPFINLSLHHLSIKYLQTKNAHLADSFLAFCGANMTETALEKVVTETKGQYKSPLWRELRYGRITGSLVYEVARCNTSDGSTIDKIFGKRIILTKAMRRGRDLETEVKLRVEELLKEKVYERGLFLSSEIPCFGASPDGIGPKKKYCVEIKCPATPDTYKTCVRNGKVVAKHYFAQIQLQMHITKIHQTKFCVADPDFEQNRKVEIIDVTYDQNYVLKELIDPCTKFWKKEVYPKICDVVK